MNSIDETPIEEINLDLKYCERCGGLWLRPQGAKGVYCATCYASLAARPDPGEPRPRRAGHRKSRLPKGDTAPKVEERSQRREQHSAQMSTGNARQIDYLEGVAAIGVCA